MAGFLSSESIDPDQWSAGSFPSDESRLEAVPISVKIKYVQIRLSVDIIAQIQRVAGLVRAVWLQRILTPEHAEGRLAET